MNVSGCVRVHGHDGVGLRIENNQTLTGTGFEECHLGHITEAMVTSVVLTLQALK